MTQHDPEQDGLSAEELDGQQLTELPNREAMSLIDTSGAGLSSTAGDPGFWEGPPTEAKPEVDAGSAERLPDEGPVNW